MASALSELTIASRNMTLVRLRRSRFDSDIVHYGCVSEAGSEIVVLHRFSDRLDLDGYDVFRTRDIATCELDFPNRRFYERVFKIKRLEPRRPREARFATMRNAIAFAGEAYGLIAVFREEATADEVTIGRVVAQTSTGVRLKLITSAAEWVAGDQHHLYSSVTRLGFGAEYENTLSRVAFEESVS